MNPNIARPLQEGLDQPILLHFGDCFYGWGVLNNKPQFCYIKGSNRPRSSSSAAFCHKPSTSQRAAPNNNGFYVLKFALRRAKARCEWGAGNGDAECYREQTHGGKNAVWGVRMSGVDDGDDYGGFDGDDCYEVTM